MATIPQNMKNCEIQILNDDKISYPHLKSDKTAKQIEQKHIAMPLQTSLEWKGWIALRCLFVFFGSWWCWICRYHRGQSWKIKGKVLVFGFTYSLYSCTGKFWDRIYEILLVKLLETNIETSQLLHENFFRKLVCEHKIIYLSLNIGTSDIFTIVELENTLED